MLQAQDDYREQRASQGNNTEKEEKEQGMSRERKNILNSHIVFQLGSVGPSMNEAGEPKRYVAHPRELVAATRPGVAMDGPSRDTVADANQGFLLCPNCHFVSELEIKCPGKTAKSDHNSDILSGRK